jgi:protein-S-isoprenylcysteine O-methyltransferase Ste14
MNAISITRASDLIGRLTLIAVFLTMATKQTLGLIAVAGGDLSGPHLLDLATRVGSLGFVVLVVGLTALRLDPIKSTEGIEPRLSALAGTFLSIALLVLPPADIGTALRITSLVLMVTGFGLSIYVLLWLGRAFSIVAQARRLVTNGPYAIVRHPLYLCEAITIIGIALAHFSMTAVLILATQWMFQLRRISHEDKVLAAAFPESAAYVARTPKIIPKIIPKIVPRLLRA